jgi:hypothetical protein
LTLEAAILLGVVAGRFGGMLGGVLLALPALLHGEWATLPFNVLCGFIAGQLRIVAPDREDIWSFSPVRRPQHLPLDPAQPAYSANLFDWQIMFFTHHRGAAVRADASYRAFLPGSTFSLESPNLVGGDR